MKIFLKKVDFSFYFLETDQFFVISKYNNYQFPLLYL